MRTYLAALALRPEAGEERLRLLDREQLRVVDLDLPRPAVGADGALGAGEDRLAPQALQRDLGWDAGAGVGAGERG